MMTARVDSVLRTERVLLATFSAAVVLAWVTLWLWGISPYRRFVNHEEASGSLAGLPLFVTAWILMTVAMMLPTSLPLVQLFRRMTRQRRDGLRLLAGLVGGYLGVWALFGVLAHLGDGLVHLGVDQVGWFDRHPWLVTTAVLVAAGVYQFAPLKTRCLKRCRTPLSFIAEYWGRGNGAFELGARHGLFCVGCCWALMLLMFAVGVGNLGWMLALGVLSGIEKNVRSGERVTAPLGLALVAAGVAVFVAA